MNSKQLQLPLFVYGTLLPGQPNYALVHRAVAAYEPAWFENGRLYDMGYYPMMVEEPGGRVKGVVLAFYPELYDQVLHELDILEGYSPTHSAHSVYHRMRRKVKMENGRLLTVWVYLVQTHMIAGLDVIEGGDWEAHIAQKKTRVAEWWATVKSVTGLYGRSLPE